MGIFFAALAMLLFAWFFDSVPALYVSVVTGGFLAFRAIAFLRDAEAAAAALSLSREATPITLRQGGIVTVATTLKVAVPRGMKARASDIPPSGSPVIRGQASSPDLEPGDHSVTLRYGMTCLSSGSIRWKGIDLLLSDPFYSLTLPFRSDEFREPAIHATPVGRYHKREGAGIYGEKDLEKLTVVKGYGIRAFRDYISGDDPRSIDWKLSAKHGKLFVREYSGISGKYPLLVVDLPDSAVLCPQNLRDQVLGAALEAAREMSTSPQGCSLMIISGANLLAFLPHERSLQKVESALFEFHSPQRTVQCYRTLDPIVAEALRARISGEEDLQSDLGKRLLEIYTRFIPEMKPLPFDVQCARVLSRPSETALHVLTTGTGDISHLATLGLFARRLGVDASLGLPEDTASPHLMQKLRGAGYTLVRVV